MTDGKNMFRRIVPVSVILAVLLVLVGAVFWCSGPKTDFNQLQSRLKVGPMSRIELEAMFGPPTRKSNIEEATRFASVIKMSYGSYDARSAKVVVYEHLAGNKSRSYIVHELIGLDQKDIVCAYGYYIDWD